MSNEYTTIKVKKEVGDKLKTAVGLLNGASSECVYTVAGLVSRLAEAYDGQLNELVLASNTTGWVMNGIPIISNSDGAKHYEELLGYEPIAASFMVSDFIRHEAMTRRFKMIAGATSGK
jgi:hypothetical protein